MKTTKKRVLFERLIQILWADWPSAMPKPSKKPELPQPKSSGGRLHVGRWPIYAVIYAHVLKLHQLWSTTPVLSEASRLQFANLLNEATWYVYDKQPFLTI